MYLTETLFSVVVCFHQSSFTSNSASHLMLTRPTQTLCYGYKSVTHMYITFVFS